MNLTLLYGGGENWHSLNGGDCGSLLSFTFWIALRGKEREI